MNSNKGSPQLNYKPANFDDISKRDSDPDVLMKGHLQYLKAKKEETVYYIVKKAKQQIRCFKTEHSTKVCRKFNLKGAKLSDQPVQDTTTLNIILHSGRIVALLDFQQDMRPELVKLFEEGNTKTSKSKTFFNNFKKGCIGLVKAPIKISSGTITVLEKIGDGARKAPDVFFAKQNSLKAKKAKRKPQDPAQGLLYGAESIITEVAGALVGLVSEPMKGAKKRGIKGATAGLGKGIVGLIFKPVAGTIDLVTHTARGVGTVPSAIYKNVFKIKSKKKDNARTDPKEAEKNDLELVFEDDKQQVFVNKKSLSRNILPTEKLKSLNEVDTAALDYKEKYELEREKREQLAKIMENIIGSLDKEALTRNHELINKALKISEIEEDEKDDEISSDEENISRVISYYEGQNPSNNDTQEELVEFFFVKAASPRAISKRNTARLSIQTNSFDDKPDEKGFRIVPKDIDESESESDSSASSAYDFDHVMNQNISAYDSDGFDGDEFKSDEVRVAYTLASHTGREGRNGPMSMISPDITPKKTPFYGKVLDLEQEEATCGLTLGNREDVHGVPLFSHQASLRDPVVQSRQYLMSRVSLGPEEIDFTNMHQLVDMEVKHKIIKKWNYPQVNIDLPYKEIEDSPNVIRLKDFDVPGREYSNLKGKELVKFLEDWKFLENKEDARYPYTNKKGGKIPENELVTKKIRSIAKEFIMKVGRTVLSGNFNLTTIPFPIKASVPKSYLENIGYTPTVYFPLYLNLAMKNPDPLQRFKFYIVSSLSYFYLTTPFAKPLNPILGETLTGYHVDGGRAYLEQISHHPPISYLLYHGPKDAYKVWGPSMFSAHAGLNSLSLTTKGWRKIQFADTKQVIHNTFPNEYYEGSFWGTFYTETVGTMDFVDKENKIFCQLKFGSVKKKPSDYFEGSILVDGKPVSTVSGTCLGWIEVDGFRYFDYRFSKPFLLQPEVSPIPSDFRYRRDYLTLKQGYIEEAQKEKDTLEQLQRNDNKLRKEKHDKASKHKGK